MKRGIDRNAVTPLSCLRRDVLYTDVSDNSPYPVVEVQI